PCVLGDQRDYSALALRHPPVMAPEDRLVQDDGRGDAAVLAAAGPADDRDLAERVPRVLPLGAEPPNVVLLPVGQGKAVDAAEQRLLGRRDAQPEELGVGDDLDDAGCRPGPSHPRGHASQLAQPRMYASYRKPQRRTASSPSPCSASNART